MEEIIFDYVLPALFILVMLAVLGLAGGVTWAIFHPPESYNLPITQWNCTRSHQEQRVRYIMVGKVMVPQYYTATVCDQYNRK